MKELIDEIYPLSQNDYKALFSKMKKVKFNKGDIILQEGNTCKGIYYIESGIIGLSKIYKEREYYQDFFFEASFATNIISLTSNEPSQEYLKAVENIEARYISKEQLINLYQESSEFKEFGRRLLEKLLSDKTKLSFIRSSLTAKEKYEYILDELPHFIQRIPLTLLSSYLGMTRETLSRMRNSLKNE